MKRLAVFILALCVVVPAEAAEYSGQVVGVADGDTITVLHDDHAEKVRLASIDCPESKQAFGQQAKKFTADHCFNQQVKVSTQGRDRYGRQIGEVLLPDGSDLNRELVAAGLAWHYRRFSNDKTLQDLEDAAREHRLGLWQDASPIPPWEFRKHQVEDRKNQQETVEKL